MENDSEKISDPIFLMSNQYSSIIEQIKGKTLPEAVLFLKTKKIKNAGAIAEQLACMEKAKIKCPTFSSHKLITYPSVMQFEQSSSEATALFKSKIISGEICLDLTAGWGMDSYFLSKVFKHIYCVEPDIKLNIIRQTNCEVLGIENMQHFAESAEYFITKDISVDWIYIDPSRRIEHNKVVSIAEYQPNILNMLHRMKKIAKHILIKVSPMVSLADIQAQIKDIEKIYLVEWHNELREILLHIHCAKNTNVTEINCVRINKDASTFDIQKIEQNVFQNFSEVKKYIYEPSAAYMKSGAYGWLCNTYRVWALHPNTHIFTSDELIHTFPGRKFEVVEKTKIDTQAIHKLIPDKKANVSAKNLKLNSAELKNKLKLEDGGDIYVFGLTDLSEKQVCLICRKV